MADWIARLLAEWGYAGVALLMLAETVFPPLPSEVIMPMAGLLAARHGLSLPGVIAAGTAGAMIGNCGWYLLARAAGEDRLRRFVRRHGRWLTLSTRELDRADRWFDRWGGWLVALGRLIPTVRSLVSIPAGLFGMGWRRFLVASTIGTAAWTGGLAWAGHELGRRSPLIATWAGNAANVILALLLAVYVVRLIRTVKKS